MTEADTCRQFVVPRLQAAGWDTAPRVINEQRTFTDGRILFTGGKARRGPQKRADYLLRYRADFPIAVVEAKANYRNAGDGLQQAKEYAEILGLKFAYATNGTEIIEFDYTTGIERTVTAFSEPDNLWRRLRATEGIADDDVARKLLTPTLPDPARPLRYYQEIAVNRATQAVLQRRRRILLTLCTGSGKTAIAFQICWKLWSARWHAVRRWRVGAHQGRPTGRLQSAHDRPPPRGGVRALHRHPDQLDLLRHGRPDTDDLVLRAAASRGPQEVHQDRTAPLRGACRLSRMVERP